MTFEESVQYLESFINYEKKAVYNYKTAFKLERIRKFNTEWVKMKPDGSHRES